MSRELARENVSVETVQYDEVIEGPDSRKHDEECQDRIVVGVYPILPPTAIVTAFKPLFVMDLPAADKTPAKFADTDLFSDDSDSDHCKQVTCGMTMALIFSMTEKLPFPCSPASRRNASVASDGLHSQIPLSHHKFISAHR